jgi:hypothetical protein
VDGTVHGVWTLRGGTLTIKLFETLTGDQEAAVLDEGAAVLGFAGGNDIRLIRDAQPPVN